MTVDAIAEGMKAGEAAKEAGCEQVLESTREEFTQQVTLVFRELANTGNQFTVDAVHARVTARPHHPNAWGAAIRLIHESGIVRVVGRKKSSRVGAHARLIPIYQGTPE